MTSNVPHGGVLALLLFILFINDSVLLIYFARLSANYKSYCIADELYSKICMQSFVSSSLTNTIGEIETLVTT